MNMRILLLGAAICFVGAGCTPLNQRPEPVAAPARLTPDEVSQRVKAGELGGKLAGRAQKSAKLWMQEVEQDVVDMQIFYYSDYRSGINLLVENGKVILLCAAWGSGPVSELKLISRKGRKVLKYTYNITSGLYTPVTWEYELGSGKGFPEKMIN